MTERGERDTERVRERACKEERKSKGETESKIDSSHLFIQDKRAHYCYLFSSGPK